MNGTSSLNPNDIHVLTTRECVSRFAEIAAFEEAVFEPEFAWDARQTKKWSDSGAAFHAAAVRKSDPAVVTGSLSVYLGTQDSCRRLVRGEISEHDLVPWKHHDGIEGPVLYLASVISPGREQLPRLYASLAADISEHLLARGVQATDGLAIASCERGRLHLIKNGFRPLGYSYRGTYPFMSVTAKLARTAFWRGLLTHSQPSAWIPEQPDEVAMFNSSSL